MHVTLVQVHVKPEYIAEFIAATRANHLASVREPGCIRFDVLQSDDNDSRFVLYEAYRSAVDAAAHKETGHYLTWRQQVADWMAEPRQGIAWRGLYPA